MALVVAAAAAAVIGFGRHGGGGAPGTAALSPSTQGRVQSRAAETGIVVITMRGYVRAARTLHRAGGPAHYREAGRFRVVWRIPAAALAGDRTFRSSFASVTGTTSTTFDNAPAKSCSGRLTARRKPFLLRVTHGAYDAYLSSSTIGVHASPSPIATASSPTCSRGMLAARWRLAVPRSLRHPPYRVGVNKRSRDWWIYNHPAGAFYGENFTPMPKGGDSEGWITGWGSGGSLRWLTVFRVRRLAAAQARSSAPPG